MDGLRGMIVGADIFRGFFDILPHAFREPELCGVVQDAERELGAT